MADPYVYGVYMEIDNTVKAESGHLWATQYNEVSFISGVKTVLGTAKSVLFIEGVLI